jgi:tartrate dehydratase alpha subunit/fumarate hydratase class I-like protein
LKWRKTQLQKPQLEAIFKNLELAGKLKAPICQDTGLSSFYIRAGAKALGVVKEALIEATRIATREIPLRSNTVDPIIG